MGAASCVSEGVASPCPPAWGGGASLGNPQAQQPHPIPGSCLELCPCPGLMPCCGAELGSGGIPAISPHSGHPTTCGLPAPSPSRALHAHLCWPLPISGGAQWGGCATVHARPKPALGKARPRGFSPGLPTFEKTNVAILMNRACLGWKTAAAPRGSHRKDLTWGLELGRRGTLLLTGPSPVALPDRWGCVPHLSLLHPWLPPAFWGTVLGIEPALH